MKDRASNPTLRKERRRMGPAMFGNFGISGNLPDRRSFRVYGARLSLIARRPVLRHDIHPMQTLNVGAGRSDQEYKAAEEQRLADLRSDVQTYAMYFFVAAGLAGLGTGLLPIRLFGFVNIGFIDLLRFYGGELVRANPLVLRAAAAAWVLALFGLGMAGRKGQRWAFWAGVILYAADMLPLIVMFSLWAFGIHGFFIFQWFKGQRALGELKASAVSREDLSRSAVSS